MGAYTLFRPLIFSLPPETAHNLTFGAVRAVGWSRAFLALEQALLHYRNPILKTSLCGLALDNPLGLAAGFDKDATLVEPLLALGFGLVEVGTVTPLAQPGNPKPRLFRLAPDEALINRMGFNNRGAYAMAAKLARPRRVAGLVGVNLGKNKETPLASAVEDYLIGMHALYAHADYLTVNISSPNTPGLRGLQEKEPLAQLAKLLVQERNKLAQLHGRRAPLLVKLAPDLDEAALEGCVEAVVESGVDAIIATNTTIRREGLSSPLAAQEGGLSGQPLFHMAKDKVAAIYRLTGGKVPIIGAGGVATGRQALEMILAGASLVQVYSALIYRGPALALRLKRELAQELEREGFTSVGQAVGQAGQTRPAKTAEKRPAKTGKKKP